MTKIAVELEAEKLVEITQPGAGGPSSGRCLVCGEHGLVDVRAGYAHGSHVMGNRLIHAEDCPVGKTLDPRLREAGFYWIVRGVGSNPPEVARFDPEHRGADSRPRWWFVGNECESWEDEHPIRVVSERIAPPRVSS